MTPPPRHTLHRAISPSAWRALGAALCLTLVALRDVPPAPAPTPHAEIRRDAVERPCVSGPTATEERGVCVGVYTGTQRVLFRLSSPGGITGYADYAIANLSQRLVSSGPDYIDVEVVSAYDVDTRAPYPVNVPALPEDIRDGYLRSDWGIQADDPDIAAKATALVAGATRQAEAVERIVAWVRAVVVYDYGAPGNDASSVFRNRRAVCAGFSNLAVAMLRAAGIPARVSHGCASPAGYVTGEGGGWHAWIEVYYPDVGWVASEPQNGANLIDPAVISGGYHQCGAPDALLAQMEAEGDRRVVASLRILKEDPDDHAAPFIRTARVPAWERPPLTAWPGGISLMLPVSAPSASIPLRVQFDACWATWSVEHDGSTWSTIDTSDAAPGAWASAVAADGSGALWAIIGGNLWHFDGTDWTENTFGEGEVVGWVNTVAADASGHIWAGTGSGALYHHDGSAWETHLLPEDLRSSVNALGFEPTGAVWAATQGGVGRYDGSTWTTTSPGDAVGGWIHTLALDPSGHLWAAVVADRPQVARYDGSTWTAHTLPDGEDGDYVRALAVDGSGDVWLGTNAGLTRYDGASWTPYPSLDGTGSGRVLALAVDPAGHVWMGTDRGLSRFDGENWYAYAPPTDGPYIYFPVYAIAPTANRGVWMSTGLDTVPLAHLDPGWLFTAASSGNADGTVPVAIDATGLPMGLHKATVTLVSTGPSWIQEATVPVRLHLVERVHEAHLPAVWRSGP